MPPHAYIASMKFTDGYDGTQYVTFPDGQLPSIHKGSNCRIDIIMYNNGTSAGTLYLTVQLKSLGVTLCNFTFQCNAYNYYNVGALNFTMPQENVVLSVAVGHL